MISLKRGRREKKKREGSASNKLGEKHLKNRKLKTLTIEGNHA